MKGHVDLLGPATKGEELIGIPSFETPDYSELFAEEKKWSVIKKAFLLQVVLFKNLVQI
jgi:hypothetical protein